MSAEFLHCYLLDRNGGRSLVDHDAVAAWKSGDGLLWVHLDVEDPAARDWLGNESNLTPNVIEALLAEETRPRSYVEDTGGLIVLRGVNSNPGNDPEDMVSVRVWIERDRIISTRRRKLLSIQDVRSALDAGIGPKSAGEFLVALIGRLADRIGNFVDDIEDRIAGIEESDSVSGTTSFREAIAILRRQVASVRRFLAPQRDALDRLYRHSGSLLNDSETQDLREETDRLTRYLEDIDLARERLVVVQEELIGIMAQEQNTRMYVLSIVAAVFLPLTFITGLLGMNVGGLPGVDNPGGFIWSVAAMVAALILLVAFLRWKRWL